MSFSRPTLAPSPWLRSSAVSSLALLASGCFASHGLDGVAPGVDGGPLGMCIPLASMTHSITCEVSASGEAFADITASPTQCCSSGTTSASVVGGVGGQFEVTLAWSACDCCRACRCVGPTQTTRVALGRPPPGTYEVVSDGQRCSFTITAPEMCRLATADEARLARVLFDDQPFAATLIAREGRSCDCRPRVAPLDDDDRSLELELELCDCCDACDCIDGGYEASVIHRPLAVGTHPVVIPHGMTSIEVTTRDRCRPLEATALRIVPPDETLVVGSPRLHWAVVSGTERVCCVQPSPAVDDTPGPAGEHALTLYSCTQEDCECVGSEVPFEAWHALGELAPGTHVVQAGALGVAFEVP